LAFTALREYSRHFQCVVRIADALTVAPGQLRDGYS
jgi:hypothetical protein